MGPAQAHVGGRVRRIQVQSLHEEPARLRVALARRAPVLVPPPEDEIVGLEVSGRRPGDPSLLDLGELHREGADDLLGHLVLEGEDVADLPVVALGPEADPVVASMSWAVIRTRLPARWMPPSST